MVRYWTIRLLGDRKRVTPQQQAALLATAKSEPVAEVRAQLASSVTRLPGKDALPITRELLLHAEDVSDKHVPLLLWWAVESKCATDRDAILRMLEDSTFWHAPLVQKFGLPFHHVPHEGVSREAHEAQLLAAIEPLRPDYLVLAKYMRVLSPAFVAKFPARIINIHHSFLPAFVGAKPYQQAFDRGVKVIGATAHFVTDQLDQGPIIIQQVIPVDHTHGADDMAQSGRDVEQMVLARALRLVLEDRVFLCGNRTIIFD